MGNIMFLTSTHRGVPRLRVTETLYAISKDRFRDELKIDDSNHDGWDITAPGSMIDRDVWRYSWDLWRTTSRKLECKHAHGMWNTWIQMLVMDELGFRLQMRMSDEGVSDPPWAITPAAIAKIDSYRKWFELMHSHLGLADLSSPLLAQMWEDVYLADVPADWREEAAKR